MPATLGPAMTLLGLPFYEIGEEKLREVVRLSRAENTGLWLNLVTQDHLQRLESDQEFHHALIGADILIPESWLLVSACRQIFQSGLTLYSAPALLGAVLAEMPSARITALMPQRAAPEALNGWWGRNFPQAPLPHVLGMPTDMWIGNQSTHFIEEVIGTQPELIVTFLPAPLQEKWIAVYRRYLGNTVLVAVGPCADLAPLAPVPGRSLERLQHSKTQLMQRIAAQSQRLAVVPPKPRIATPRIADPVKQELNARWSEIGINGRFDAAQARAAETSMLRILGGGSSLLLNLSRVTFIDSSALGLLITLHKSAQHFGKQFVLVQPSAVVTEALKLVKMDALFPIAPDSDSARIKGDLMAKQGHIRFEKGTEPNSARIFWRGTVESANWEKFWNDTLKVIYDAQKLSSAPRDIRFEIDLGQVTFIDSLGVGLLLRLVKWAREQLVILTLANPSPPVREVIALAKLDRPLFREDNDATPRLGGRRKLLE